jgi:hypothetical protein
MLANLFQNRRIGNGKRLSKKNFNQVGTITDCKLFIEKEAVLSIRNQCDLFDIRRYAPYYQAKGKSKSNI